MLILSKGLRFLDGVRAGPRELNARTRWSSVSQCCEQDGSVDAWRSDAPVVMTMAWSRWIRWSGLVFHSTLVVSLPSRALPGFGRRGYGMGSGSRLGFHADDWHFRRFPLSPKASPKPQQEDTTLLLAGRGR